jgi:hypothetical protein
MSSFLNGADEFFPLNLQAESLIVIMNDKYITVQAAFLQTDLVLLIFVITFAFHLVLHRPAFF